MGSTTCSDPGFAVLQPLHSLGKGEKGNFFILLGVSFIRTALAKTAMTSPSLATSTGVPNTVRVVLLLWLQGRFPDPGEDDFNDPLARASRTKDFDVGVIKG